MDLQRLYSLTRKALEEYNMIEENDRIAVGISGGKDSLALLYALHGLKRFYPKKFEIEAITVNLNSGEMDFTPIKDLCNDLGINYTIVDTEIYDIIFNWRKEKNPCSLCAKMRKGTLNDEALKLGCNKIAYAHHRDDIIETMFMSMIYEGRFNTFAPVTYLDRMDLTLIRPFLYLRESDIVSLSKKIHFPVVKNTCPADGYTKRQAAKELIKHINDCEPGAKDRMFSAIKNGTCISGWKIE